MNLYTIDKKGGLTMAELKNEFEKLFDKLNKNNKEKVISSIEKLSKIQKIMKEDTSKK